MWGAMHRVWIICRCGHEGWGQTAKDVLRLGRDTILRQARCMACGTRGAVELRLVYVALELDRPDDVQGAVPLRSGARRWSEECEGNRLLRFEEPHQGQKRTASPMQPIR